MKKTNSPGLDKQLAKSELRNKFSAFSLILIFGLLLALFFLTGIFLPDKIFSQSENRYLAKRPEFSLSSLLKGEFTSDYENYIDDQFLLRDQWILLKVRAERLLLKKENNMTVFGKDSYLFNKYIELGQRFDRNSQLLLDFAKKYPDRKIYFGLAPNSYEILSDQRPQGLYNVKQKDYLDQLREKMDSSKGSDDYLGENIGKQNLIFLNLYQAFEAQKEQYIYYKSDHHWTTEGAWYAYEEFSSQAGLEVLPLEKLDRECLDDFQGTFYPSSGRNQASKDKLCWYPDLDAKILIDGQEKDSLYDLSYLEGRDKYALFLHNNPAMAIIKSPGPSLYGQDKRARLLVFKDSYANSLIPFLTDHYEEIMVLDLRYFNGSISDIMAEGWEEVLFLFNFISFADDPYLLKIAR